MNTKLITQILVALLLFVTVQTGWSFYNPNTGRWLTRDPVEEKGGLNLYVIAENNCVSQFDPYGKKTYDFVKDTYYKAQTFAVNDVVISNEGTATVKSGNMWPIPTGSNLDMIQCLLSALGFTLSAPNNGVYFADFAGGANNAFTVGYGTFPKKQAVFLDDKQINVQFNTFYAEYRIVTVWHEFEGHAKDDQKHDNAAQQAAFEAKYEAPVISAMKKLKSKTRPADMCWSCVPKTGSAWPVENEWEKLMCKCGVPPHPSKINPPTPKGKGKAQ